MNSLPFIEDFEKKSREVKRYCLFLKGIESQAIKLRLGINHIRHRSLENDLETTLKGAVFLLLYNLVESTLRDGIQYIYDVLRNNQVNFDDLNQNFRLTILKTMKSKNLQIGQDDKGISLELVNLMCQQKIKFSGNLDAKEIREILNSYGLIINQTDKNARGGADLEVIKRSRNSLAHGHSSFSEKGRDYSADDLLEMQKRVDKYLKDILTNIEKYVSDKKYLKDRS